MNNENENRNSRNRIELEGNVANISDIQFNKNGKKTLRFDLGQNNNGSTQFVPIILRGNIVDSYNQDIKKGNWIFARGRVSTYQRDVTRDNRVFKDKVIEIIVFEIEDRTNNKLYTADGNVQELTSKNNDMER